MADPNPQAGEPDADRTGWTRTEILLQGVFEQLRIITAALLRPDLPPRREP